MTHVDPEWPERLVVRAPRSVDLLTDLTAVRYLAPFLRRPHTLSTAAGVLEKPPSTIAYWIPKFLRAGLLEELAPIERAGMPMRRYRAAARELAVPIAAMPLDRRVALLDEGRYRLLKAFLDGLDELLTGDEVGGLVYRAHGTESDTGLAITVDEPPGERRWYDSWLNFRLTDETALAFAQDLEALVARYDGGSRGRAHIVHLGFAPEPRHRWRSSDT